MKNNLYDIFLQDFKPSYYKRVSDSELDLYIGKNSESKYCLELRGAFSPTRINSSVLINVKQYKHEQYNVISFALEDPSLLERFSIFCADLLSALTQTTDINKAYQALCQRYFAWRKLFQPNTTKMSEPEIMGLIGELLTLQQELIPHIGQSQAIEAWSGAEKTTKDFSFNSTWIETKAVSLGKDTIRISSIEQLDSDTQGYLIVFFIERMSPSYEGISLNKLVRHISSMLQTNSLDLFYTKLVEYGFDFSNELDNFVYRLSHYTIYDVNNTFPRLKRDVLPPSIRKAQYELSLPELESYKQQTLWK